MIIFFFSDVSWEGLYQRPHHIAKRLSKNNIVIWIEPLTFSHKPNFKLKHIENNLYTITIPAIPYNARNKILKRLTLTLSSLNIFRLLIQKTQIKFINKIFFELKIKINDEYIFFFENYQLSDVITNFKPTLIIYDYIDNALGFTKLPKHVIETWNKLIKNSNFIFATSNYLINQIQKYRKNDIYLVTNGVEYEFFSSYQTSTNPTDLPVEKKIVGYIGAIYPWLDYDLIEYLCSNLPDINFTFIGKTHPDIKPYLENLQKHKNFFYLGFKNYSIIPSYLSKFSVGIIPFKRTELTEGVNPVKLFEYSAMGIPTVCTNFSDDLEEYKNLIFISSTKEDFVQNILSAIRKSTESEFIIKLKNFAKQNDWDEKYQTIMNVIQSYY
ncbi:MAG: Glycosyltransferase [Ignavibacteriae bacterium]|nr:MAG: Glycosyltransferase [Ignavibacteriota bacterium]